MAIGSAFELGLNSLPDIAGYDRIVLAFIGFIPVSDLADIERVLQKVIEPPSGDDTVPDFLARAIDLSLGADIEELYFRF